VIVSAPVSGYLTISILCSNTCYRVSQILCGRGKQMRKNICLLVLLVMAGCMASSQMNDIIDTWKGAHFSELIASWGTPQMILDNQRGGNIYVWSSVLAPESSEQAASRPQVYPTHGTFWFWTDRDGIIYKWAWRAQ
jgi:hypothetical protein